MKEKIEGPEVYTMECPYCKIHFWVSAVYCQLLIDNNQEMYCPNGHKHYIFDKTIGEKINAHSNSSM